VHLADNKFALLWRFCSRANRRNWGELVNWGSHGKQLLNLQ